MSGAAVPELDVVVLGGGIAGLWLLDRLRAAGFGAALLERSALGDGQSVASQGIIHSGLKYRLPGGSDLALADLADMPERWRAALAGRAGPDLRAARLLSPQVHVWVPPRLGAAALAGTARAGFRSATRSVARTDWPAAFGRSGGGALFSVDEPVLDVPSVLVALAAAHRPLIRRLPDAPTHWQDGTLRCGPLAVNARCLVIAAGAGNELLPGRLGLAAVPCQRRPLHQVLVAGLDVPVYAHCAGASVKPLATVTSHPVEDGGWVWYVGGGIAEDGAGQPAETVVARARELLPRCFPGVDFSAARYAGFAVDRAEHGGSQGQRPGDAVVLAGENVLIAWPTKLALAPRLADLVLERLAGRAAPRGVPAAALAALADLPEPDVALPPWQTVTQWS